MESAALVGSGLLLAGCSQSSGGYSKVTFVDKAPDGPPLKAGLIGCGGRGSGAAVDFLLAGPNLQITALGDVFADRLASCRQMLQSGISDRRTFPAQQVPEGSCFVGFDAYHRVIDSGVDLVLLATPPHFRPEHFSHAVNARKHVFMEKPVAVDPVGVRSILDSARKARSFNLSVATGTQRRHQRPYIETFTRVAGGAIGKVLAARCYWNQGQARHVERQEGWTDMEYMIRDWGNWCWLSGDHIVEQHIHNLDVVNWFVGEYPVKALGMGGRMRRVTGDQYDFFCVDYTFDHELHTASACRQIDGCANHISEVLVGTEGSTNCRGTICDKNGKVVWQYQEQGQEPEKTRFNPYEQEQIDLVTAIRTNKPLNEAENTAYSTLTAIMGRVSAYTGREVTWEEMLKSDLRLGPKEYAMTPLPMKAVAPLAGQEKKS